MSEIKLIQPDTEIKRTVDGFYRHPDMPFFDEGQEDKVRAWSLEQGLEEKFVFMYEDISQELLELAFKSIHGYMILLPQWEPTLPAGNGWFLLEISDTYDDGPVAVFVRRNNDKGENKKSKIKNIPAFPRPIGHTPHNGATYSNEQSGMSLRDYFAAKAMQGLVSIYWEKSGEFSTADELLKCHAEAAYEYADAMLKEREK